MNSYFDKYNNIIRYTSKEVREILLKVNLERMEYLEEIRLRANKPLIVQNYYEDWFVNNGGNLVKDPGNAFIVKQEEVFRTLEIMSRNSIYAFQHDIKKVFLTFAEDIEGQVKLQRKFKVVNIKDITSLNIRISKKYRDVFENPKNITQQK